MTNEKLIDRIKEISQQLQNQSAMLLALAKELEEAENPSKQQSIGEKWAKEIIHEDDEDATAGFYFDEFFIPANVVKMERLQEMAAKVIDSAIAEARKEWEAKAAPLPSLEHCLLPSGQCHICYNAGFDAAQNGHERITPPGRQSPCGRSWLKGWDAYAQGGMPRKPVK